MYMININQEINFFVISTSHEYELFKLLYGEGRQPRKLHILTNEIILA